MKPSQPLIITPNRVEAYIASALRLLGWLLSAVLRLNLAGRGLRLRQLLNHAERGVESILFLMAVARFGPPPQRRRGPPSAPQGFRRVENRRLRLFFRGAKIRARKAGALARMIALIDALTRPERAVAYFFKQICKGLRLGRLVAAAPPADALRRDAYAGAASSLDSS